MRPVQIALQLIEVLSAHQPSGVTELSNLTGLPRSTTQRVQVALQKSGWIEFADGRPGNWALSLRALVCAGRATESHGTLRNLAIPVMEELRRATEETIHLMVRQGNSVVLVERLDGILPVDRFRPFGTSAPLALSGAGMAILATLAARESKIILRHTAASTTLTRQLTQVRRRGFSVTQGANRQNIGAVGAAIIGRGHDSIAAISVSGPLARMTPDRCTDFGPLVVEAARKISEAGREVPKGNS